MLSRVLIANRGEIARRIRRTCTRLGIATVAVHSDADRDAPHAREADVSVRLGPAPASESYLSVDRVVEAAVATGCDAVHPGYGFLAEHAGFARAVTAAGLTFVGPPADVIELLGDKALARRRFASVGVPVVPGIDVDDGDEGLIAAAADVGYPLLVKAVAGGGGKGMRRVDHAGDLPTALAGARREAAAAFGDDRVLLERLVSNPRHVEVQVFADQHGEVVHLLDRECSIQRRHQKVVEEAPCAVVGPRLRERLTDAAVRATAEVGYEGAGTVEFLVDGTTLDRDEPDHFFLEMNTRLQVEHPVTEAITGLDLVELQLRVAAGEPLEIDQSDVRADGHAIEVRVCAEDPVSYLPQTGPVVAVEVPHGPGVRFDSGIEVGDHVSPHYDPLVAKLVVHGTDRDDACRRLRDAVRGASVRGVVTNLALLTAIADHPAFRAAELTTSFLPDHLGGWRPPPPDDATILTAVASLYAHTTGRVLGGGAGVDTGALPVRGTTPWASLGAARPTGAGGWPVTLATDDGEEHHLDVRTRDGRVVATRRRPDGGSDAELDVPAVGRSDVVELGDGSLEVWVHGAQGTHRLRVVPSTRSVDAAMPTGTTAFTAPMPGSVLTVEVAGGDRATAGTTLVVIEAMKMEHPIVAPADGTVITVHVGAGDPVVAGTTLLAFEPDGARTDGEEGP